MSAPDYTLPETTTPSVPSASSPAKTVGDPAGAATKFVTTWASTKGLSAKEWRAKLVPLATDEYGKVVLPSVVPAAVPAHAVTGPAAVEAVTGRSAQVRVPTDAGDMITSMADTSGKGAWKVATIYPAR